MGPGGRGVTFLNTWSGEVGRRLPPAWTLVPSPHAPSPNPLEVSASGQRHLQERVRAPLTPLLARPSSCRTFFTKATAANILRIFPLAVSLLTGLLA